MINNICKGDGECLTQDNSVNGYSKNPEIECHLDCQILFCPNHEFCGSTYPLWFKDCRGDRCIYCDMAIGDKKLEFVSNEDKCPVCLEQASRKIIFPACSHKFCVQCSKNIIFWDGNNFRTDPVPYGAPPCPHHTDGETSCKSRPCNLEKGIDYDHSDEEELDERFRLWSKICKIDFELWNNDDSSLENLNNPLYGSRTCPLCSEKIP